jgi:archaellum component FlaC
MFGAFTDLEFVVPAITPGIYTLRVVDEYGASTGSAYTFTVTPAPVTTVALNAVSYYQGDRISFNIFTTENNLGTITVTINDPLGATWWTTNTWTLTGAVMKRVLYQDQLFNANPAVLPADAPLGNWNWTVTYTPASTGTATTATGLFAVAAPPTMQTITDLLMELGANITEMKGEVATIETTVGEIQVDLADLDATITGFDGDMATIQTSLGTVQTTVSSLNADIITIKAGVSGIEGTASSLDAVLGVVAGDTAYLKSAVANITGTVTDVSDGVATIETDLGTLKVDVASIKTDVASVQTDVEESLPVSVDMMPVWIAVVLSLIAAIAAIFAVVTIRQKIAG